MEGLKLVGGISGCEDAVREIQDARSHFIYYFSCFFQTERWKKKPV